MSTGDVISLLDSFYNLVRDCARYDVAIAAADGSLERLHPNALNVGGCGQRRVGCDRDGLAREQETKS